MAESQSGADHCEAGQSGEELATEGTAANAMSTEGLIEDGKNLKTLFCQQCPSKILRPKLGSYQEIQFFLPYMKKKVDMGDSAWNGEQLSQYWAVDDIYKFENMGFSNTIGNTKYLVCADCEMGPLGWHDLPTKMSYVSLKRIKHQ